MIVVSNTSPITNLAAIRQLALLRQLYENVLIPQAVYEELISGGGHQPGAADVQTFTWIETRAVKDCALMVALGGKLDEGEAEAIALAKELAADLLLLDERRGRVVASRLALHFVGVLGTLIEAKHRALLAAVKPVLDDLITKAGSGLAHSSIHVFCRLQEKKAVKRQCPLTGSPQALTQRSCKRWER